MKVNKLTPNLEVISVKETIGFYKDILGFSLIMAVPESQDGIDDALHEGKQYVYALVKKDDVEIMFQRSDSFKRDVVFAKERSIGASVSFYMEIEGLDGFFHTLKNKVDAITEPQIAWYGMREFYIKDNNGYILGFAEKAN